MCVMCVFRQWSPTAGPILPLLIVTFLFLYGLSQLLPPALRSEFTSPMLASVVILVGILCWYEVLVPTLSVWQERRSARLREQRIARALVFEKLRKEATRRCRNCRSVYHDQNPCGGRFMCSFCGHISKRPVLELPNPPGRSGIVSYLFGKNGLIFIGQDWLAEISGNWVSSVPKYCAVNGHDLCLEANFFARVLYRFIVILRWILRKLFRIGSASGNELLDEGTRGSSMKGENGVNFQERRGGKARRKAADKKLARLDRKMLEVEERKQIEEVARMVEEWRKLRSEVLEAEERSKCVALNNDMDRGKQAVKRTENRNDKDKGTSKSNSGVEEFEKSVTPKEKDRKRELDKKKSNKRCETQNSLEDKCKSFISPDVSNFSKARAIKPRHLDRTKGSTFSSSKGFNGAFDFRGSSQRVAFAAAGKSNKPASGFVEHGQNRRDARPMGLVVGRSAAPIDVDRISKSDFDRVVGPKLRPQIPAPKISWRRLFSPSSVSSYKDMNNDPHSHQKVELEQAPCTRRSTNDSNETNDHGILQNWVSPVSLDSPGLTSVTSGPYPQLLFQGQNKEKQVVKMNSLLQNSLSPQVALDNLFFSGINSQNFSEDHFQDGRPFSPLGPGMNKNDTWLRGTSTHSFPVDKENHFPPFNTTASHIARNDVIFKGANDSDNSDACSNFERSPSNYLSRMGWDLGGGALNGIVTPGSDSRSLFFVWPGHTYGVGGVGSVQESG